MVIKINFESDEALYLQLYHQIIFGIASSLLKEGDPLPPVRQMAGEIGINMHTVNKAYALLREEGFVTIDRRKGAVIAVDADHARALAMLRRELRPIFARAFCLGVSPEEIHAVADEILEEWHSNG